MVIVPFLRTCFVVDGRVFSLNALTTKQYDMRLHIISICRVNGINIIYKCYQKFNNVMYSLYPHAPLVHEVAHTIPCL